MTVDAHVADRASGGDILTNGNVVACAATQCVKYIKGIRNKQVPVGTTMRPGSGGGGGR